MKNEIVNEKYKLFKESFDYKNDDEQLKKDKISIFANELGLKTKWFGNTLNIESRFDEWFAEEDYDGKINLYRKNKFSFSNRTKKYKKTQGKYHFKHYYKDYCYMLKIIAKHDKFKFNELLGLA